MAEPNPAQIAPGEEAASYPIDEPYIGFRPGVHVGPETLNGAFQDGVQWGLY